MATLNITPRKTLVEKTVAAGRGDGTVTADKVALGRGTDTQGSDLLDAIEKGGIVTVGTTTPVPTDATSWIHIRTDLNAIEIKQRTGTEGAYQYEVSRRIFMGDSRGEIIYHSGANPPAPAVSWNSNNGTFNITSGGWGTSPTNAQFFRIVTLRGDSANTVQISPQIRIGSISSDDIPVSADGSGNIPNSVSDLTELVTWLDEVNLGGTGTGSLIQTGDLSSFTYTASPPLLQAVGSAAYSTVTVNQNLLDYRSNYNKPLFVEAFAKIQLEASAFATGNATYSFEIQDTQGNAITPRVDAEITLTQGSSPVIGNIRLAGNLPSRTTEFRLAIRVASTTAVIVAGVDNMRFEIRPTIDTDEVIVDNNVLSGNLHKSTNPVTDLDDTLQEIDSLPIQYAQYGNQDNRTISAGSTHSFDMPIPELVQRVNQRNGHSYRLRVTYQTLVVAGSGALGPRNNLSTWTFSLTKNSENTNLISGGYTRVDDSSANGTVRHTHTVPVASDATKIVGSFAIAAANDADINVTDLEYDFEEPRAVSTVSAANVTVNTANFDGNLDSGDTNMQLVAQAVDDLATSANASGISIQQNQISSSDNFIGGLNEPLPSGVTAPGLVNTPANAQQAFVKTDYMLQQAYNPFQLTQNLDHLPGGTVSESFTLSATTGSVTSSLIDVPDEITRLEGADAIVRVRVRIASITNDFAGNIELRNGGNLMTGVDAYTIDGSTTPHSSGNFISFERQIPEGFLENISLTVRFNRTSGTTTTGVFNQGFVYIADAGVDTPSGQGPMGQTAGYSETIIWRAGPNNNDRYSGGATLNLDSGYTFGQFDLLEFIADTGSQTGNTLGIVMTVTEFKETANYGSQWYTDFRGYNVRPQGTTDNQFQFVWGNNALRRVRGINT